MPNHRPGSGVSTRHGLTHPRSCEEDGDSVVRLPWCPIVSFTVREVQESDALSPSQCGGCRVVLVSEPYLGLGDEERRRVSLITDRAGTCLTVSPRQGSRESEWEEVPLSSPDQAGAWYPRAVTRVKGSGTAVFRPESGGAREPGVEPDPEILDRRLPAHVSYPGTGLQVVRVSSKDPRPSLSFSFCTTGKGLHPTLTVCPHDVGGGS